MAIRPSSVVTTVLAVATVVLLGAPIASAGEPLPGESSVTVVKKWRDCQNKNALLDVRSTATHLTDHGSGRTYYLKSRIEWEVKSYSIWRNEDQSSAESGHFQVTNRNYVLVLRHADRTVWGSEFNKPWRAHLRVQLFKARSGPDLKVWETHRYFGRAVFPEKNGGGLCSISV